MGLIQLLRFTNQTNKINFVATDASDATYDKIDKKAYFYQVPIINKYSTEELSKALGIEVIKIIGISDLGFAKALKRK